MRNAGWVGVGIAVLTVLGGCGSGLGNTREVTRADLGDSWPLTAESGSLKCEGSAGIGAVTIEVDGTVYAVNGAAAGQGEDITAIWAPDLAVEGTRINMQSLISEGLALCS